MKRRACGVVEVPKPPCTHARRVSISSKFNGLDGGGEFDAAILLPEIQPQKGPIPMLKLHAGVSKKVGLPGFSSASASCTIEAELDSSLLTDREGFQMVVRRAYQSCEKAVQDQIARLTHDSPNDTSPLQTQSQPHSQTRIQAQPRQQEAVIEVQTSPAIRGSTVSRVQAPRNQLQSQPSPRPATASQVKAIRAIASRRRIDLVALLRQRFGLQTADSLGIRQASDLIDELKNDDQDGTGSNGHTNGTYATNGGAR